MTKVLVADDFPLVRDGFAAALARDPSIRVVGFAVDGVDALEKTRALKPDVLLLDLRMPRMSGLMALTQLTAELPQVRVLVVSDLACDDSVVDAVAAGAAGFISKHITGDELCEAVHAVKRGEAAISVMRAAAAGRPTVWRARVITLSASASPPAPSPGAGRSLEARGQVTACSVAQHASCVRRAMPVFARMCARWLCTVRGEM